MSYFLALFFTIIIEIISILVIGLKNKDLLVNLLIVNILTNPTLNFIVDYTSSFFQDFLLIYVIFLELLVVIFEWLFLKIRLKKYNLPFFKISFFINTISFFWGLLIIEFCNGVLL